MPDGDTGEAGTSTTDTTSTSTTDQSGSGTAGAAQGTGQQTTTTAPAGKTYDEAYVKGIRDEAAANRVKARDAEDRQNKVLAALGLKNDGKVDPEELAKQNASTTSELRQARTELAIHRAASKHQADADALLDSRAFLASLADLDPTAADFGSKVDSAIKAAVKDNPKLKTAGQAPTRNAAEITGGSGDGAPITEDALKRMTPEQIVKAQAEGKLAHFM